MSKRAGPRAMNKGINQQALVRPLSGTATAVVFLFRRLTPTPIQIKTLCLSPAEALAKLDMCAIALAAAYQSPAQRKPT